MDITASVGLSLTGDELPYAADRLRADLAEHESCDLRLALGLVTYLTGAVEEAEAQLRQAFLGFQRERRTRRAALAAAHLGRLEYHALVNPVVAAGWFARGVQLLDGDDDCVERGWLALGMLGCSVTSADQLHADAQLALRIARSHRDPDLECRALGDYGLALVGQGDCAAGMAAIDQAMTMAHSGECTNLYVTGQVQCSFISACERMGDVPRLEGWLAAAVRAQPGVLGPEARPNVMLNHCRTEYGSLLRLSGRWREAEATLCRAAADAPVVQKHMQILADCALADLRVSQGRLAEAADLLAGLDGWDEARIPLARLQLARGEHDKAAAACRLALLQYTGDRLRGSVLLALLADAELARGDLDAAATATARLAAEANASGQPPVQARAALAAARVALANDDLATAVTELERGIARLTGAHWALLRAELHLELATALADTQPAAAVAHAQRALAIFGPIAAPQRLAAQRLLAGLGELDAGPDPLSVLTTREREILRLLARGLSNPQIAARLVIAPKTAEHHVGAILRKLGMSSRSEAAVYVATLDAGGTAR
ncbi:MAG TPA: LuxR C-terminal-related transcriptional regulator [Jatrophihabitans sp.]|nr:LuxR C-terminal-related transcriptional regulator [Jatrophihabitans sp.]